MKRIETIGVFCYTCAHGGAERATLIWAKRRAREGRRIVWFCDDRRTDEATASLAREGLPWPVVPLNGFDPEGRAKTVRESLERRAVDTVLLVDHWWKPMFDDLRAAKAAGCRVIVAEHNAFHFPLETAEFDLFKLRFELYPQADVLTVLSPENVAWWKAAGLSRNVVYMPNYLTFEPAEEPPRHARPEEKTILYAGRVCERKGAHFVLRAFARLREEMREPSARLVFLGRFDSPEFEARLRAEAARPALAGAVEFAGQVDDVEPFFRKAALFAMASRIEGAPMVLMESKSQALPAVIFEMPYVDGTHPGQGVVSVPYGDVEALAREMARVLSDEALWTRLSREAFASLAPFRADVVDARWRRVFDALEQGGAVEADAPEVSAERMLPMTMQALKLSLAPLVDCQDKARCDHEELDRIKQSKAYAFVQGLRRLWHRAGCAGAKACERRR